jgi:hypothetical protein
MNPPTYQRIYCCRCCICIGFTEAPQATNTVICYSCVEDEFNVLHAFGITNDNVFDRQGEYKLKTAFVKRLEMSRNVSLWTELRTNAIIVTSPPNFDEKFD